MVFKKEDWNIWHIMRLLRNFEMKKTLSIGSHNFFNRIFKKTIDKMIKTIEELQINIKSVSQKGTILRSEFKI